MQRSRRRGSARDGAAAECRITPSNASANCAGSQSVAYIYPRQQPLARAAGLPFSPLRHPQLSPEHLADLRDITWMIRQWKRFRRLLGGATGIVWLLCCGGVIFIGGGEEEAASEWFLTRVAFVVMFIAATGVSIWLFISAWRELRRLEREAQEIRQARGPKQRGKKGPAE